jgi:Transglutaminase-like enzymes, putative cysteine proteases
MAQLDNGVINVAYKADNAKLKVMIEKDSKKYTYNLRNDGVAESFPLQLGNGEYTVSVLKNIKDNQYSFLSTEKVSLNLDEQNKVYLTSIQNVNWNGGNAAIKKAKELTAGLDSDSEKLDAIYNYIVDNYRYDYDKLKNLKYDYLPDIDSMLNTNKGICYDYSSLFAAMLRSVGIPTKLVKGYTPNAKGYHAWNEVYISETGSWLVIDTTYDSQMKASKIKYKMVKDRAQYSKVYEY